MKIIILIASFLIASVASAAEAPAVSGTSNNVNYCNPNIVVKGCGSECQKTCKPTIVEKKVEVIKTVEVVKTKREFLMNKLHLLVGYGAKGNLVQEKTATQVSSRTENGIVAGLQYVRTLDTYEDSALSALIQVQSNRTISLGIGLEF